MSDEIGLDIKKALSQKIAMEMNVFLEDKYKNDILIDQNHQFNVKFFELMTDIFLKIFYVLSEEKPVSKRPKGIKNTEGKKTEVKKAQKGSANK
jgi:hypothetical protein